MDKKYQTNLEIIARKATLSTDENLAFHAWLKLKNDNGLDDLLHKVNNAVTVAIDCTQCGNCCHSFIINLSDSDLRTCADFFKVTEQQFVEKYVEVSAHGELFINKIPCHFFENKKCTIYDNRFTECRDFPHLSKPNFISRMLSVLSHYGTCPIVYNVIEELKMETGFH